MVFLLMNHNEIDDKVGSDILIQVSTSLLLTIVMLNIVELNKPDHLLVD